MIDRLRTNAARPGRRGPLAAAVLLTAACLLLLLLAAALLWVRQARQSAAGAPEAETAGLLVTSVLPESPADQAGLTRGTILLAVDGLPVDTRLALEARLAERPGNAEVALLVWQDGRLATRPVTLAADPPRLGVTVLAGDETGLPAAEPGLPVVTQVIAGSPAADAGFVRGDIIVAVADRPVASVTQLLRVLAALQPGAAVAFTVQRAGVETRLIVVVGSRAGDPQRPYVGLQLPPGAP